MHDVRAARLRFENALGVVVYHRRCLWICRWSVSSGQRALRQSVALAVAVSAAVAVAVAAAFRPIGGGNAARKRSHSAPDPPASLIPDRNRDTLDFPLQGRPSTSALWHCIAVTLAKQPQLRPQLRLVLAHPLETPRRREEGQGSRRRRRRSLGGWWR